MESKNEQTNQTNEIIEYSNHTIDTHGMHDKVKGIVTIPCTGKYYLKGLFKLERGDVLVVGDARNLVVSRE